MNLFDCDLGAPRGLPAGRYSSAELARIFGGDDSDDTGEAQECHKNYYAALTWVKRGYNVVPLTSPDKKYPGVKWKPLQTRRVTEEELSRWRPMFANGVGFITGKISDVIVIETDGPEGDALLAEFERQNGPLLETLVIRSGSGRGLHRHFKHPGYEVRTKANPAIKIDVKGDGGFCVLPPSLHKNGGQYRIEHDAEPAELPQGLLEFIESAARKANGTQRGEPHAQLRDCNLSPGKNPDRQPPPGETMRAMLKHLADKNYFEDRGGVEKDSNGRIVKIGWLETGMALKPAYGEEIGFDLWAVTHIDDKARNDAPTQWASFASEPQSGYVTIGLIIKAAKDAGFMFANKADANEPGYLSYGSFTMDTVDGLSKEIVKQSKNPTIETVWISAPFEVLGACRDPHGRAWGKLLRFRDADSREHLRHVSAAALQGEPATLCATLADEGLGINRSKQKDLAEYLSGVSVGTRVTIVNRTGWHQIGGQRVFTLPSETVGAGDGERVILEAASLGPYETCGALEDWKQGIGALTAGHALPMLMVSAAFAGPLMHLVGAEGGGIHLFGPSSIGKSAMLQAAASVWGRGGTPGYLRSWRATANGLEGAAASATDTCLVLDELGIGEARDVAASIYTLAIGVGKQRAGRDGALREPKSWRVFTLSTGEYPVATKLSEEGGRKIRAGQTVRLLDIPADRELGFGAFDHAGDCGDSGKLADAIKHAATAAYGTAGPAFVRHLAAAGAEEFASEKTFMATFVRGVVKRGASEQIVRAAKIFALIALAGELATMCGVTPWAQGEARRAAAWAFSRWVEKRGGTGSYEEQQAIEQVRLIIEKHGEARFEHADGNARDVHNRLGWRKGEGAQQEWWILPETWKSEFCNGLDPNLAARTLAEHGMLRRQDDKNLQCVVAPGISGKKQRIRAYVLTSKVLGTCEDEGEK
jgi:uncharacterized protein (DUF927 family)